MRLLVTGTTGGIGGAVRAEASARGWDVVAVNRDDFDGSLGDGAFNAVVFASGTCPILPLTQTSDEVLAETFAVNCGLFVKLMRRLVAERLYAKSGMRVVAVSSVSAVEGWSGGTAYCASKGALSAVCRSLQVELSAKGISVTAIEPRYVRTKMFEQGAGRTGVDASLARPPEDLAREILSILS